MTDSGSNQSSLLSPLCQLWSRRFWILGACILGGATSITLAYWVTPMYRAQVILMPSTSLRGIGGSSSIGMGDLGSLASLAGVGGSKDSKTDEALAIIKSRAFIEGFIREHNLLSILYYTKWDASRHEWKVSPSRQPTMGRASRLFVTQILGVSSDRKTGVVTISIEWRDRQVAAIWANQLVARLNSDMSGRAKKNASQYVAYLEDARGQSRLLETRDTINHMIVEQMKQGMLASVNEEYAFRVIDPAVPADANDPVSPRKIYYAITGPVAGAFLICLYILLRRHLSGLS